MKLIIIISIIFFFYFLALFQTAFLVHFDIFNIYNFNLIFIAVIIWNIVEKQKNYSGLFSAFAGGFFLDIFSSHYPEFNILILLFIAIFIKFFLKKYVRIPLIEKI